MKITFSHPPNRPTNQPTKHDCLRALFLWALADPFGSDFHYLSGPISSGFQKRAGEE